MVNATKAPKRAVNLSLNAQVLDKARALGMNLSATVDALLAEDVRKRYWERWNEENKAAIAHYNARIEREHTPYFLDVQNDYIDHIATRVMAPLRREAAFGPRPRNLNPLLEFGPDKVVLDSAARGAVPLSELRKPVGHLRDAHRDRGSPGHPLRSLLK